MTTLFEKESEYAKKSTGWKVLNVLAVLASILAGAFIVGGIIGLIRLNG